MDSLPESVEELRDRVASRLGMPVDLRHLLAGTTEEMIVSEIHELERLVIEEDKRSADAGTHAPPGLRRALLARTIAAQERRKAEQAAADDEFLRRAGA